LNSGVVVLNLSGRMTMGSELQSFESMIGDLAQKQQNKIVVDMSQISYVDSSAIGALVASQGAVRTSGGHMRLAALAERVDKIFKLAGVDTVLEVHPTRDAAVAAFAAD
jgi:anti-sigma B factor antagonist